MIVKYIYVALGKVDNQLTQQHLCGFSNLKNVNKDN